MRESHFFLNPISEKWYRDRGWGLGSRDRATRVCIVCSGNDTSIMYTHTNTHTNTPSLNLRVYSIYYNSSISTFKFRAKSKVDIFHDVIVWWRHMFEKSHLLKGGTFFDPTRCWYIMRVFAETNFRVQNFGPLSQSIVRVRTSVWARRPFGGGCQCMDKTL